MKRKSKIPQNPLLPYITIDEIAAFDQQDEATYTRSEAVNAVCRAIAEFGFLKANEMAEHLDVNQQSLSGALEIAVGMNYSEVRAELILRRLKELKKTNPKLCGIGLARAVGFKSRASLWRFLRSEVMKLLPKVEKAEAYKPENRIDHDTALGKRRHRYGSKSWYERYAEEREKYSEFLKKILEQENIKL